MKMWPSRSLCASECAFEVLSWRGNSFRQARRQQAARRLASRAGSCARSRGCWRVDLPHAILDVVGHVDMAVAAEQLVVLLAHRIADRPLVSVLPASAASQAAGSAMRSGCLAQRRQPDEQLGKAFWSADDRREP